MAAARTRGANGEPDEVTERQLMRWLHGELPAAERASLAARLEVDPRLAARLARLRAVWDELELPAAAPIPSGFRRELLARLEGRRRPGMAPGFRSFTWARAASALALLAGIGMGSLATALVGAGTSQGPEELTAEESLADDYWTAFRGADAGGAGWSEEDEP